MTRARKVPGCVFGVLLPLLAACSDLVDPVTWQVPSADEAALPPELRTAYHTDAERLAARYILATEGERSTRIELPPSLLDDLYRRLVLLHNAGELAARDSVADVYAIHTFGYPATRELLVSVEKSTPWLADWHAGRSQTGTLAIDTLVAGYDLRVDRCHVWTFSTYDGCVLVAGRPLLMGALGSLLERVPGVRYASPNGAVGDGNDIRATREDGGWQLDYSVGFGDCPAGCIGRHGWRFRVGDEGRVTYRGGYGPPAPPPRSREPSPR